MAEVLPLIDVFEVVVNEPARDVFQMVSRRAARVGEGAVGRAFTRLLGCVPRGRSGSVPLVIGQEFNGFRVAEVVEPERLVLEGRHRFARYRLTFLVEAMAQNRTTLRAKTEAVFPGARGAVYRFLVIGTGAHKVVVKRMLAAIARRADSLKLEP